ARAALFTGEDPRRAGGDLGAVHVAFRLALKEESMLEALIAATLANAGLSGTVLEKGTQHKLAGIEVSIAALDCSALTDADGRFSLEDLPPGEHEVVMAAPGYLRFASREQIKDNEQREVVYRIEREFSSGLEATVQGERERQELSHTRLGPTELS